VCGMDPGTDIGFLGTLCCTYCKCHDEYCTYDVNIWVHILYINSTYVHIYTYDAYIYCTHATI
jgi:hypothetical protein